MRELSDQIGHVRVLFNSRARGKTRMRVVRELSDQTGLVRVLFNSRARSNANESCAKVE